MHRKIIHYIEPVRRTPQLPSTSNTKRPAGSIQVQRADFWSSEFASLIRRPCHVQGPIVRSSVFTGVRQQLQKLLATWSQRGGSGI